MTELQEKRNRKIGWSISIGLHLVIFLLFLFLLAWREPNPPYPEYGIEINFGLDNAGTGNIQPQNEAADQEETEQPAPQEEQTEQTEESAEESQQQEDSQEVIDNEDAPEKVEEKPVEKPSVSTPVTKEEKKEETKPVETPATKETTPAKETTKETETSQSTSQGDNTNKTGDKGDPQGELDSRALYGNKGGGDGGNSLELTGWDWGDRPKEDPYSETGYIVFKIAVDDNGEVIQAIPETYSVSLQVVRHYQNEIMKLAFRRISSSAPPPRSEGKLTIRLKKN